MVRGEFTNLMVLIRRGTGTGTGKGTSIGKENDSRGASKVMIPWYTEKLGNVLA